MSATSTITPAPTKLPTGFGRTPKFKTKEQLVERLERIDQLEQACKNACDYQRGKELTAAKAELPHGEYLKALEAKGMSNQDAGRLRRWFEECSKVPQCGSLDPAQAEQKLSRKAREEFCRADDETKAKVIDKIADPDTTKVTAKQIKDLAQPTPSSIVQRSEPQAELSTIEFTSLMPKPLRNMEPGEKTSDLYNSLLPHLDVLYQQLVIGRPDFTAEEWCSINGALRCLTDAVQPKIDHLKAIEQDRDESISVDASEAS